MADIKIIQGDYKHISVDFCDKDEQINSFYFTSNCLGINKKVEEREEDGKWYITLLSKETEVLKAGTFNFDITAETTDNKLVTGIYHGTVQVLVKDNKIQ